jgi:hypothetical protein
MPVIILTSLPVSDFDYEGVCHLHVQIYMYIFTNMAMVKNLWPAEIIHRSWSISNIIINV